MDIDEQVEKKNVTLYKCSNCTTSFCSFASDDITKCPICHGSNLEANKTDEVREIYYIPFQMTKKQAFKDYRRKTFWDPFIPFAFKVKKIDFLHKIYIPAFLLDAKQEGNITFLGGEKVPTENSKKKFVTKKYNVVNHVNVNYCGVFVNIAKIIKEDIFKMINMYDSNNLKIIDSNSDFNGVYLLSDMDIVEAGNKGREKISKSTLSLVRENVLHPLKKFQEDKTTITFENTKQVLLPIYIGRVIYKNKEYYYMMNGENGKSYLEVTIGAMGVILFSIIMFIIIFILGYCFAYFV